MPGRFDPQLAGRCAIGDPLIENSLGDQLPPSDADAFAVEWAGAEAAKPKRIVDDGDSGTEYRCAELVGEEARLAGDRGAVDRPREMAEQPRGNARVEENRILARFGPR